MRAGMKRKRKGIAKKEQRGRGNGASLLPSRMDDPRLQVADSRVRNQV